MKLQVHVIPGAQRTQFMEWIDERTLKVRVAAAPEKGKANKALVAFFSERLGVPKSQVSVIRGATGRKKVIGIPEQPIEAVHRAFIDDAS